MSLTSVANSIYTLAIPKCKLTTYLLMHLVNADPIHLLILISQINGIIAFQYHATKQSYTRDVSSCRMIELICQNAAQNSMRPLKITK
jgi:hypothetical protein